MFRQITSFVLEARWQTCSIRVWERVCFSSLRKLSCFQRGCEVKCRHSLVLAGKQPAEPLQKQWHRSCTGKRGGRCSIQPRRYINSPGLKMNKAFHWEKLPGIWEIRCPPRRGRNGPPPEHQRPEYLPAPPETRWRGPTASAVAPQPAAAATPFHLHKSHFPDDAWPHISLKAALLSVHTHSTFLSSSQGAFISPFPLLPLPSNLLWGNSLMHIA